MDDLNPQQNQEQTTGAPKALGVPTKPSKPLRDPKKHHRKAIRTYYSDIAETVKGHDVSMVGIALAEKKRQEEHPEKAPVPDKSEDKGGGRKVFAVILAVVLVLGGAGILGFLYLHLPEEEVVPEEFKTTLIPTNVEKVLNFTGFSAEDIVSLVEEERLVLDGTLNTIITFIPVDTLGEEQVQLTARMLLGRLNTHADTALLRSVLDEYSLGVHLFDKNHGFLIIKTDFFENAFAGMLRWERYLAEDLPFLTKDEDDKSEPEEMASTTEPTGNVVLEPIERYEFEDLVVANRDTRALVNTVTGDIKMIYSFPDKNTLIITTNPKTLVELFDKLTIVRRQ